VVNFMNAWKGLQPKSYITFDSGQTMAKPDFKVLTYDLPAYLVNLIGPVLR
jgi:hypothetical protein